MTKNNNSNKSKNGYINPKTAMMLKTLRKEAMLSNKQLSKLTNIPVRSLISYETGSRNPNDERKIILSEFYGKSIEEMFFKK